MRTTVDVSPLFRSGIGFDRVFDLLENAGRVVAMDNWPPYDIVKNSEDEYRISMAVAGFSQDELTITQEPNMLVVAGQKSGEDNSRYLHRGIASRPFQRRFELADHVRVVGADLRDGLLTIDLRREIPEEMRPRRIAIGGGTALPSSDARRIEGEKRAA